MRNKKDFLFGVAILTILLIALIIVDSLTDEAYLKKLHRIGVENPPDYISKSVISRAGGIQADGEAYEIYCFKKSDGNMILKQILNSVFWIPISNNKTYDFYACQPEMKQIKNGFFYFYNQDYDVPVYDRYDDENNLKFGGKHATEYEIAAFDIDNNVLYYDSWNI